MRIIYPKWALELMKKIRPYMDGCDIKEDAPEEIKKEYERYMAWFKEATKRNI